MAAHNESLCNNIAESILNQQDFCPFYFCLAKIGCQWQKLAKLLRRNANEYMKIHVPEWRIAEFLSFAENYNSEFCESPTFRVADVPFFFQLSPRNIFHYESASLYLRSNMYREFSVEYKFGLKKIDGSVEHLKSGRMKGNETYCEGKTDVVLSEVIQRKTELLPGGVLTVTCTVMLDAANSTEITEMEKSKALKLIRLDKLSENYKDLFFDKETCDVTLKVKDKEYKAHKSVLIARSSVFAATFKHDTLERQTGVITITDCDPDSFAVFLEYLYCGKLEEFSVCNALHLYYTSDKYDAQELKAFCIEYLIQHLTVENICEVAVLADKYEETGLFSTVQDFFNRNLGKILRSPEWDCLLTKDHRLANKLMIAMSDVKS